MSIEFTTIPQEITSPPDAADTDARERLLEDLSDGSVSAGGKLAATDQAALTEVAQQQIEVTPEEAAKLVAEGLSRSTFGRNEATQLLNLGMLAGYQNDGARGVQAFVDLVNRDLKDSGRQIKLTADKEVEQKVKEDFQRRGLPAPEYVRVVELVDKDGKSLGKMVIAVGRNQQRQQRDRVA